MIVFLDLIVENWKDPTAEIPEDAFEKSWIGIYEVGAVCLLVTIPSRRDKSFEEAVFFDRVCFSAEGSFAYFEGDDGILG